MSIRAKIGNCHSKGKLDGHKPFGVAPGLCYTISLGDTENAVGFRGLVPLLPHLCPLSILGVGYVGYIRKALEKGFQNTPGLHAVLTICLRFPSVLDGSCVACCLLLSTGSYHFFIQIHARRCCTPRCTTETLGSQKGTLWGCKLGAIYSSDVP